ncbi:putative integral membrane protein [Serinicoccus hydrothermalis]|uniref:Putative integral membrane protein n=1 Tax=Serinicoccus hydrothermalis TaxID=1758689 RepID=A0A1B1NEG1_9MICO|nr:CPBP family intramembrane glutamic endopeptidase [Serinicoccus hydrothermalis]ANS79842.1 putative integral membrane protein [Serinicoccus hydrothermalis]
MSTHRPAVPPTTLSRHSLLVETLLVLGVSLGASALWSVLSLARKLTAQGGLAAQTTSMNTSTTPDRPWLDLAHQLVGIGLALVPVLLAVHLLGRGISRPWRFLGLDRTRPVRDLAQGTMLAAVIGIPGLGLYLLARGLGVNTTVAPANLPDVWWAVPILVLAAVQNAVVEEVIAVGYLFTRWAQAGWSTWTIIVTSALLRGSYHLYQGFGGFVGNVAMGIILGWFYTRTRRVMPLVVAHTLLDVVAFVGYAALAGRVDWL